MKHADAFFFLLLIFLFFKDFFKIFLKSFLKNLFSLEANYNIVVVFVIH